MSRNARLRVARSADALSSTALRAVATCPFFASQRGLSGTKNIPTKNSSDGTAVSPNIQRQPAWPNQELRMNSSRRAGRQIAHEHTS